eukprot:GHRR01005346.1.p1 GENE.GHRR01005346.1~~GHRR01005346.1.p1  ORF type:complete len:287 (+),score=90.79 GHRR01005346.1:125-862(+)
MAVSDRPSDTGSDDEGLDAEQYAWLQQQLAHIGNLHIQDDQPEVEWSDPTSGILVNIFAACEDGNLEQLAANLQDLNQETQHSIDTPGPDGDIALHLASLYGHLRCVSLLLEQRASPDPVNAEDGTTPLHDAAAGGYLDIVKLLVERAGRAVIHIQDSDGDTALHNAARGGHLAVVQYLLQQGADATVANNSGKAAAEESDDPEVQRLLAAAGPTPAEAGSGDGGCQDAAAVPAATAAAAQKLSS